MKLWNENKSVIQVYLGYNVMKYYTPPDKRILLSRIFNSPPELGAFISSNEEILYNNLEQYGITIPKIYFEFCDFKNPNRYIVYIGVCEFIIENYNDKVPFNLIEEQVIKLKNGFASKSDVKQELQTGTKNLETDIQTAFYNFAKSYFNASLQSESIVEFIYSAINLCVINIINGNYDIAERLARKAYDIANSSNVYDIYAKFYAHSWLAAVFAKQNKLVEAIKVFRLAYNVADKAGAALLKLSALWNSALLLVSMGQLEEAHKDLLEITNLSGKEEICPDEFLSQVSQFTIDVSAVIIQQKNEQIQQLQNQIATLSRSFKCVVADLLPIVVKILGDNGMLWLSTGIGSAMFGGERTIINGNNNRIVKFKDMNINSISC